MGDRSALDAQNTGSYHGPFGQGKKKFDLKHDTISKGMIMMASGMMDSYLLVVSGVK